jgi:phytanoyl-CoA hydroxylase
MNIETLSKQYQEDGVINAPQLLSSDEIDAVRTELDRYARDVVPDLPSNDVVMEADGVSVRNCWRMEVHDPWFADLAKNERVLKLVAALVKGDPVLMAVESFNKPARVGSAVPPHQDNAYFCMSPPDALTVWIAVDAVTEENGPVSYLRGSQQDGARPHVTSGVAGNSMGLAEEVDKREGWTELLQPGDALIHHANVIHFSAPNTSDQSRRGLLMVFRGAHCEVDSSLRDAYALAK